MSDILNDLNLNSNWHLFLEAWKGKRSPHAVAFRLRDSMMKDFLEVIQDFFLGRSLREANPPVSPDIHVIGDIKGPPGVDSCRFLAAELAHFPLFLEYKIGIVCHAHALSPAGANGLLKITEEPPEYVFLVFLYTQGSLLPTLESRVWNLPLVSESKGDTSFFSRGEKTFFPMPEKGPKGPLRNMELHLLERLYEKGLLTKPLFDDLLCLITKEDYSFGEVFDHIW